MVVRKTVVFLMGSHAAGKTYFCTNIEHNINADVLLGDNITPTEQEKRRLILDLYEDTKNHLVEGQRFFRAQVYDAILEGAVKNPDVRTVIILAWISPEVMLERIRRRTGKEPSKYITEKAQYESYTRFSKKIGQLIDSYTAHYAKIKSGPPPDCFTYHAVCVNDYKEWTRTVMYLLPFYPRF